MIARRSSSSSLPRSLTRGGRLLVMALAVMLALGAGLALAGVRAGKYAGTTSEKGAVTLTVAAGGRKITHFTASLGYNGDCGQGSGPGLNATPATIAIGAHGAFSENVTLSLNDIANPIHDPGRVFGKVSGSKVTGTIEQFLHGAVNKCYVETFTAKRK